MSLDLADSVLTELEKGWELVSKLYKNPEALDTVSYQSVASRLNFLALVSPQGFLQHRQVVFGVQHSKVNSAIKKLAQSYLDLIPKEDWAILLALLSELKPASLTFWKTYLEHELPNYQ